MNEAALQGQKILKEVGNPTEATEEGELFFFLDVVRVGQYSFAPYFCMLLQIFSCMLSIWESSPMVMKHPGNASFVVFLAFTLF